MAIAKLIKKLKDLSIHLKKPTDVWLDPTAPTLASFLTKSARDARTPKRLAALTAASKYIKNKLHSTIKSGKTLIQQHRDTRKIETEMDNPSATAKSIWKKTAKLIKRNEGAHSQYDAPVQLYNTDGNPEGPPIISPAEQIRSVEECWTRISTPTCDVQLHLPNNSDDAPWARYPSKPPSAELEREVSTLITYLEYNKARERLATNKAPGTDYQLSNQQKLASDIMADVTIYLVNLCITQEVQPDPWTKAAVRLIHKKGLHSNPLNYRPIALLQVIYKICTSVLNSRLVKVLQQSGAIS